MTAWFAPTVRAVGWLPLAAVAVVLVGTSMLAAYADRWPPGLVGTAGGALAAAAVAGLHDPAADLLSALPTSAARRRAHRLVLLVPVALATWLAYLWPGRDAVPDLGTPVAQLLALLVVGVAVAALAPRHGVALGVAVPLACAATSRTVGPAGGALGPDLAEVLLPWQHHPWLVITAAVAALLWGRTR